MSNVIVVYITDATVVAPARQGGKILPAAKPSNLPTDIRAIETHSIAASTLVTCTWITVRHFF